LKKLFYISVGLVFTLTAIMLMKLMLLGTTKREPKFWKKDLLITWGKYLQIAQNNFILPYFAFTRAITFGYFSKWNSGVPSLELGCGDGFFSSILYKGKPLTVASDLLIENVQKASRYGFSKNFAVIDAKFIPFKDGSLQSVLACQVMNRIHDRNTAVKEIYDVLMPGGYFVMSDMTPIWLCGDPVCFILRLLPSSSVRHKYIQRRLVNRYHVASIPEVEEWKDLISACGFQLIELRTFGSLIPFMYTRILFNLMTYFGTERIFNLLFRHCESVKNLLKELHSKIFYPAVLEEKLSQQNSKNAYFFMVARKPKE